MKRLIAIAVMVVAFLGASAVPASADQLCADVKFWQPVGKRTVCVPMV
ncbi:MAG: hypothetical protein WD826_00365 [Actinomycetota bacterium]